MALEDSSKALTDAKRSKAPAGGGDQSSPGGKPGGTAMERRLFTVAEAAAYLGISRWTLYRWVSQRRVAVVKLGRAVRFDKEDLDKLIEQCKVRPGRFGLEDDVPF